MITARGFDVDYGRGQLAGRLGPRGDLRGRRFSWGCPQDGGGVEGRRGGLRLSLCPPTRTRVGDLMAWGAGDFRPLQGDYHLDGPAA